MSEPKIIAVVGATGAQGGGLVRAITQDRSGTFRARALTRDPSSPAARALADLGAEVVAADIDDLESVRRAFEGCYGAYCVTFYWAHMSPEREKAEAANMARAAKETELTHVVWSTLEDTRKWVPLHDERMPTLMGQYKVPHLDAKGESDARFAELDVPTTYMLTSFYWDNLIHFDMGPKPGPDGRLVFSLPMGGKKLAGIAAQDIGKCAYGIFRRGRELIGRTIGIAGAHLTGAQMAAALAQALGREVVYEPMDPVTYRNLGFPGADDLANMFQFYADFEVMICGARGVESTRALNPELLSFEQWLALHKDEIKLA
jgi:uncharacterized protein YbjT (DUF2867 family)